MKHKKDIIFLIFIAIFILLFLGVFIRGQKQVALIENRALAKLPTFDIKQFIKGNYQETLENSLADQLILSHSMKVYSKYFINKSNKIVSNIISYGNSTKGYSKIAEEHYVFNNGEYILNGLRDKDKTLSLLENSGSLTRLETKENIDTYLYYVDKDASFNFEKNESIFWKEILEFSNHTKIDRLKINNYEDYKKYYFKTDHHWNSLGSYIGYKDIIKMICGEEEKLLEPKGETTFDNVYFYGSKARSIVTTEYKELFSVYAYDLSGYKEYINGKEGNNTGFTKYFSGEISKNIWASHYAAFYGTDKGEIVYDFDNIEKDNLLIFSNSYSNPINHLIASHFNKTHVIDLRHYANHLNKSFDLESYIKENSIDKILVLGDINLLAMNVE